MQNSSKFEISSVTKSECFILALKLSIPKVTLLFRLNLLNRDAFFLSYILLVQQPMRVKANEFAEWHVA